MIVLGCEDERCRKTEYLQQRVQRESGRWKLSVLHGDYILTQDVLPVNIRIRRSRVTPVFSKISDHARASGGVGQVVFTVAMGIGDLWYLLMAN